MTKKNVTRNTPDTRIPKTAKKWIKKRFEDKDKIDWYEQYDSELSIEENKQILKRKFKEHYVPTRKEIKNRKETAKEKEEHHRQKRIAEKEQKTIQKLKDTDIEEIQLEELKLMKHYIKMAINSDMIPATIIEGKGGLGKSHQTIATVKEETDSWAYLNTYSTPLALYKYLYDNNPEEDEEKTIILDDVQGILKNKKCLSILKGALGIGEKEKRIVSMETTSPKLKGYPDKFICRSNLVIIANDLPENKDIEAVKSRTNYYKLDIGYQKKLKILKKITEEQEYKGLDEERRRKAYEILKEKVSPATENLNIRTLFKTFEYLKYGEGKEEIQLEELLEGTLRHDEELQYIYERLEEGEKPKEIREGFNKKFGYSGKSTYYRRKKKLEEHIG